jgi:cation diffusion facilitator family transporter
MEATRQKMLVAGLSVLSNCALVAFKIIVGMMIGSVAILSEAIHSGIDMLAAVIAFVAVRASGKAADREHPFGHGKAENLSGTIEAILIFAAAGWIVYEAVKKLIHPVALGRPGWGVIVMLVSVVVNILVSQALFRVARRTDSIALEADAWHLRTDVWTSAGVMLGLGVLWLGDRYFRDVNIHWLDPLAALAVAALIVRAAWHLTKRATRDLLDEHLPTAEEAAVRELIIRRVPTVHGFHHLRTRRSGATRFVEFHLLVGGEMSVADSHRITEELTREIRAALPGASVTIHIEPCDARCGPGCAAARGCLLDEEGRAAVRRKLVQAVE